MMRKLSLAAIGFCAVLSAQAALAETKLYVAGFDALCAAGQKLSTGWSITQA